MSAVGVRYKCVCMGEEVELQVPERKPVVDVVMWLEDVVTPRVAADHMARSPQCRSRVLEHIKLPVPPDGIVGGTEPPP